MIKRLLTGACILFGIALFLPPDMGGGLIYADGSLSDMDSVRIFLLIVLCTCVWVSYWFWRGVRAIERIAQANPTLTEAARQGAQQALFGSVSEDFR